MCASHFQPDMLLPPPLNIQYSSSSNDPKLHIGMDSILGAKSNLGRPGFVCRWVLNTGFICNNGFSDPTTFYNHLTEDHVGRKSSGKQNLACMWQDCKHRDKPFTKRDHIVSHCRSHVPFKTNECMVCKASFKWPHDLKKHCIKLGHVYDDLGEGGRKKSPKKSPYHEYQNRAYQQPDLTYDQPSSNQYSDQFLYAPQSGTPGTQHGYYNSDLQYTYSEGGQIPPSSSASPMPYGQGMDNAGTAPQKSGYIIEPTRLNEQYQTPNLNTNEQIYPGNSGITQQFGHGLSPYPMDQIFSPYAISSSVSPYPMTQNLTIPQNLAYQGISQQLQPYPLQSPYSPYPMRSPVAVNMMQFSPYVTQGNQTPLVDIVKSLGGMHGLDEIALDQELNILINETGRRKLGSEEESRQVQEIDSIIFG